VVLDHNLVYGNGSGSYDFLSGGSQHWYTLGTTISADPLFVSDPAQSFNPQLSASSPAIGAGLNFTSTFSFDFDNAARPSSGAWDLGAFVH
jgi:hypothetical protein